MTIFNSYLKLPEGITVYGVIQTGLQLLLSQIGTFPSNRSYLPISLSLPSRCSLPARKIMMINHQIYANLGGTTSSENLMEILQKSASFLPQRHFHVTHWLLTPFQSFNSSEQKVYTLLLSEIWPCGYQQSLTSEFENGLPHSILWFIIPWPIEMKYRFGI